MNKKGFTLVELLAIIIVLSLLVVIASTSVSKIMKDSKKDLYNSQIKMIESAAKSYGSENINDLPAGGECKYITLGELKEHSLIDPHIKNPKTNKEFNNDMIIKISSEKSKYNTVNIIYEVDSKEVSDCEKLIKVKTINDICKYNSDYGVPKNTVGAKYTCDLGKEERNFYILELGSNPVSNSILKVNEVALILEGNYDTTTQSWCDQNGPNPSSSICAADGLSAKIDEIASVWTKIKREQISLPSGEQISVADGQNESAYKKWITLSKKWLYNWPDNPNYGSNPPLGYWTSSISHINLSDAWGVYFYGHISDDSVSIDTYYGVRPVITLKLD